MVNSTIFCFCPGIASDGLKHRVFEVSLADLQNDSDAERSFRKFKLICEDVQGKGLVFLGLFTLMLNCDPFLSYLQISLQ
jgi:ribosomal protein S3AE